MEKLRKYLDERGLRYDWFAREKMGLSPSFFSAILTGKVSMPKKHWKKIITVTEGYITLEDLWDDKG